jgi:hypothetical protein
MARATRLVEGGKKKKPEKKKGRRKKKNLKGEGKERREE